MAKYYKGKYALKKPEKYVGDAMNVVYRSSWERAVFKFMESRDDVIEWSAEEVVIPYRCGTDNRMHRYFIDLYFKTRDGKKFLIEIKPDKETKPPKTPTRKTKRYINEQLTYVKNMSKWKAATSFAQDNGVSFQIWTEKTLKSMGIKIL